MSYYDEEYQHGQLIQTVAWLLRSAVRVTDEATIKEICAPLEATPYSELRDFGQHGLMVHALQNYPELLAQWELHQDAVQVVSGEPKEVIRPGLIPAPQGFRPLNNPDQCIDTLKALVAPSFYVKTDKDGKESYELRPVNIDARS